jgi:diguanylate cyclase (GGDEF)-like protein
LWEEDFSRIKLRFDELRGRGISDLDRYLEEHPDEIEACMRLIRVLRVNHHTLEMFAAGSEAELLANLAKAFRGEMRDHFRSELKALWTGQVSWSGEGINYTLKGKPLNIRLYWRILPECEQNWECVMVAIEDLTQLKRAENRFRDLFNYAPISLWEEDFSAIKLEFDRLRSQGVRNLETHLKAHPDLIERCMGLIRVLDVNHMTVKLFGAQDKASLMNNLDKIFRDEMRAHFASELLDMWNGSTTYDREGINYSLAGEPLHIHLNWRLMPGHEKDFDWVMVAIQDVTARKKAEDYLRYLGTHDVMTGLFNRTFFEEAMQKMEGERQDPISIIILDLNSLKTTNDQLGHHAGDNLIRRAGEILKASLEENQIAARIGGDEFAILMPDSNRQKADEALERLDSLVAMNNKYYREPELSLSMGTATSKKGVPLEKTVGLADDAMYKNKGRHHRRRREDKS